MLLSGALWNMFIFFTFSGAFSFMHLIFFTSVWFLIILLSFNQSSFILSLFLFFLWQTNIKANTTSRASKPPTLNPLWAFLCIMTNILYTVNSPFSSHLSVLELPSQVAKHITVVTLTGPCVYFCILWQSLACETQAILNTATLGQAHETERNKNGMRETKAK